MAVTKVYDVIYQAKTLLQESGEGVHWPVTELQTWLNEGYRAIVLEHPRANAFVGTHTCTSGVRQDITDTDASAIAVVDVVRNLASTSKKRPIFRVDRTAFSVAHPDWYVTKSGVDVEYYMVDGALPQEFLVYPPATTAAQLEVVFAKVPTAHALSSAALVSPSTTDVINVGDIYVGVLVDYILYRAHSKDIDVANIELAAAHKAAFDGALKAMKLQ